MTNGPFESASSGHHAGMQTLSSAPEAQRPLAIDALIERYDPDVIDLLGKRARIRLASDEGEWDVVLRGDESEVCPPRGEPDALISATDDAWRRLALDVGGGLSAFGSGKLRMRRNLHLGVGFLAATSGATEPGRLRFDSYRTSRGRISVMEAGRGEPLVCI